MSALTPYRRLVIKIGSALLVEDGRLRRDWLKALCADVKALRDVGTDVVIVSSGAVALGCHRLGLQRGALDLAQKQACAAVGQSLLTRGYEVALGEQGLMTAQALLTLTDTEDRRRWLNARATLSTLLSMGVVPVVNENDTVATEEIRYGDNDRLAARTAQMVGADGLVLLSDVDGLYSADPRQDETATHIAIVDSLTEAHFAMASGANASAGVGTGGMTTKLLAAQIATQAGCDMIICDGRKPGALGRLGSSVRSTLFKAVADPKRAKAQWIAGSLAPSGRLTIDDGALVALQDGRSLLAAGLTEISGSFQKGDTVSVIAGDAEIARGLTAYDSNDLTGVLGLRSDDITHPAGGVVIHRDNLVML